MENQDSTLTQPLTPQVSVSAISPLSSEVKPKGKKWKIVGTILIIIVVIFSLLAWYGFRLENQNQNLSNNSQNNNMNTLTKTTTTTTPLTLEDAQSMVQMWYTESRASDRDVTGSTEADSKGGFLIRIKGAIFRYEPAQHQLLVSGLVGYKIKTLGKYPVKWQFLVRTGQREYTTMMYGEAQFELLRQPLFELEPDVVLLTKAYKERLTGGRKLSVQITWLLLDADYWFVNRYNEVMATSEEDLIKGAKEKNEWMLKNRPKPW